MAAHCLAAILGRDHAVTLSSGGHDSPGRTAKAMLRAKQRRQVAVVEAALFHKGDMERHSAILRPDVAVILGWRPSAPPGQAEREAFAVEHWAVTRHLHPDGLLILDGDDIRVMSMVDRGRYKVVTFGQSERCNFRISKIQSAWPKRLSFRITSGLRSADVQTNLVGAHWANAVAAAIATAVNCGMPLDRAAGAIGKVAPLAARMQPVLLPPGATLLRDEYSSSRLSLDAALAWLGTARAGRRVALLGDFDDPTLSLEQRARHLGQQAAQTCDLALFAGPGSQLAAQAAVEAGMPAPLAVFFESAEEAALYLEKELAEGDLALLKTPELRLLPAGGAEADPHGGQANDHRTANIGGRARHLALTQKREVLEAE